MQGAIEAPTLSGSPTPPWPVAEMPAGSWLALNGDTIDDQIGLFVAALADRIEVAPPGGCYDIVDALLAEERLIIAGGLQVGNPDVGVVVVPGCCAGLEDWRDWAFVLTGGSPWLGHGPGPEVEMLGEDLRVWQDGGPNHVRDRRGGRHIDFRRNALPELLMGVQRDLTSFLDALTGWAEGAGLGLRRTALVKAADQNFVITSPWDLRDGSSTFA